MIYKINQLAELSGVTTRTLRYYDQIDLLKPSRFTESGYRLYSEKDVDRLQQILLYKKIGLELNDIKHILIETEFDIIEVLLKHQKSIKQNINKQEQLLQTINDTIRYYKGEITMADTDKFEGLKETKIQENEEKYGTEIREKYGNETIEASYQKMRKMSKWEYQHAEELNNQILSGLRSALHDKNPTSETMQHVCKLHQEWISLYWPVYQQDAHLELVHMYTVDERFRKYYDAVGEGATDLLYLAMKHYIKKDN